MDDFMNPAQDTTTTKTDDQQKNVTTTSSVVASTVGKEQEGAKVTVPEVVSEITPEVVLPKEAERAGVEVVKETIELPPDVKKLGVTPAGPSAPVTTTAMPQVVLPISDPQVVAGFHAQIISSLRWLATWCIRKLKKAHIILKNIHGKIVRVRI